MSENNHNPFLVGEKIFLRAMEPDDLPLLCQWANDSEIRKLTGEVLPMNMSQATEFLKKISTEKERVWFSVVLKENDRVIGEAGLLRMFPFWRTTDLTLIIGEKDCWGKGYGTEAILLLLDYAFGYLNFHRVAVGVVGFNERAVQFYQKVGFETEGVQRDGYYYDHHYHDFIMMSILENEFRPETTKV